MRVNNLDPNQVKVKEIAREYIKVAKDEQYSELFWKLDKFKDTHLVVVDDNDQPIGIISTKDFTRILTDRLRRKRLAHIFASGLMTPNPISISGEESVVNAVKIMLDKGISSLLVKIDDKYKIITKRDFLKHTDLIVNKPLQEIMTENPITAAVGTKLTGAEMMMREKKISTLPVVDDGELVGHVDIRLISRKLVELFLEPEHKHPEKLLKEITLGDIMANPLFITPETDTHTLSKKLLKKEFKGTGIVTSEGNPRVIGVTTETDIAKLVLES